MPNFPLTIYSVLQNKIPLKYAPDTMSKAEESRPTKRRRTEMSRPEGFISNAPPKPPYRPPEPQFQSAFEEDLGNFSGKAVVR